MNLHGGVMANFALLHYRPSAARSGRPGVAERGFRSYITTKALFAGLRARMVRDHGQRVDVNITDRAALPHRSRGDPGR